MDVSNGDRIYMLLSVSMFWGTSDNGFQGSSPLCLLRSRTSPEITSHECLFLTVLLVYFLRDQVQASVLSLCGLNHLWMRCQTFFSVCEIYFCFSCTSHYCNAAWRGELWAKGMAWCPAEWGQLAAKRCGAMSRHFEGGFSGIDGDLVWGIYKKAWSAQTQVQATFNLGLRSTEWTMRSDCSPERPF